MTDNTCSLPVLDVIKTAWSKVKGTKGVIWGILGTILAIVLILSICAGILTAVGFQLPATLFQIVSPIVSSILIWSVIYVGIQRALDLPIHYGMIKYPLDVSIILSMIGLAILRFLILLLPAALLGASTVLWNMQNNTAAHFGGALLFIVSTVVLIFLVMRMALGAALVLDKRMNPWQAIKLSFKTTRCHVWRLIGIFVISELILFVSILPLGIGLIWSLPYIFVMYGEVYKRLAVSCQDKK